MLQRVAFAVAGTQVEGILHLPDGETLGGVANLPARTGLGEPGAFLCAALAAAGIAALRFDSRVPDDVAANLADAAGAIRLLRAHPAIPQRVGIVGHSYGGAIAGIAAGRDSRIRAAALLVPPEHTERYAVLLRQAGVAHRVVRIEGADHQFTLPAYRTAMLEAVTSWFREALAG